jgi:glycosyltransferase involved in cell wall biosynthesis
MAVYCIIPAWNEEKTIENVVREAKKKTDEVVVVDDGSLDRTAELASKSGAVVLRHIINRGQGAALETGNSYARNQNAEIVVHFDADGQFLPDEIPDMIEPIASGRADMVFGSRFLTKRSYMPWSKRWILMPIARLVNWFFFRVKLTDPQSGFRAFNRAALNRIRIEQDDMAHCSEIIAKAHSCRFRIEEVPVTVIFNCYGSGFGRGIRIVKDHLLAKLLGSK